MNATTTHRVQAINNFVAWCQEPYIDYLKLNQRQVDETIPYFEKVMGIDEPTAIKIITMMRSSIEGIDRYDLNNRDWIRCCVGIAKYILPGNIKNTQAVAGVIVRLSGWVTTGASMYQQFRPVAENISTIIWGKHIRYLKIREWYSGPHVFSFRYGTLWDFAKEFQIEETEIRAFSSRILNFICAHNSILRTVFEITT